MGIIRNIIDKIDLCVAFFISILLNNKAKQKQAILIPAADIVGGFGEDIMVAGFLQEYIHPVTILSSRIDERDYIRRSGKVKCSTLLGKRLKYCSTTLLLWDYTDLFVIGADILDGVYDNNRIVFNLIKTAHRLGLDTHITGFSVREKSSDYFIRNIKIISNYTPIKARDIESLKRLAHFIPESRLTLVPDVAFLCKTPVMDDEKVKTWSMMMHQNGKKILAYCPNTIQAKMIGKTSYIEKQIALISSFIKKDCAILFLYHDLRKYALGISDKDLSKEIYKSVQHNDVMFVDNITDGYSLKKYLSVADFTVTGRMHFGISGYTLGLPMFGISYYGKFEGLQKMFKISPEESLLNYELNERYEDVIDYFITNIAHYRQNIQNIIGTIVEKAKANI